MAKSVYYEGKLIPAKDWDYVTKKPKAKEVKAKKDVPVIEADTVEVEETSTEE